MGCRQMALGVIVGMILAAFLPAYLGRGPPQEPVPVPTHVNKAVDTRPKAFLYLGILTMAKNTKQRMAIRKVEPSAFCFLPQLSSRGLRLN